MGNTDNMRHQSNRTTFIITLSGLAVFVIGAVLGSFLVLSSGASKGKSFYIQNIERPPVDDTEKAASHERRIDNYTKEFSETALRAVGTSRISDDEQAIDALAQNELRELIAARRAELRDPAPDFEPRVVAGTGSEAYLQKLYPRYRVAGEIFAEIFQLDVRELSDPAVRSHFARDAETLDELLDQLATMKVSPTHKELHTLVFEAASALRIVADDIARSGEDPVTALLFPVSGEVLLAQMEQIITLLP